MSLVIANNVQSVTAQNNLTRTSNALGRSLERLSSGFKINRGADGPAALVISEKQRAQIAGLQQAIENSEKAVTLVQTAEGALAEINTLLVKIRTLALDSANEGVNDSDALAANQAEITNALETINRIANNTQFGTKKLLDGTMSQSTISDTHVSSFSPTNIAVGTYDITTTATGSGTEAARAAAAYAAGSDGAGTNTVDAGVAALTDAANEAALLNSSTIDVVGGATLSVENSGTVASVTVAAGTTVATAVAALNTELTNQDAGYTASVNASGQIVLDATDNGTYGNGASVKIASTVTPAMYIQSDVTASGANVAISDFGGQSFVAIGNRGQTLQGSAGATITLATNVADSTTYSGAVTVTNGAMFQVGPNQNQTVSLSFDQMNTSAIGVVGGNQFANLAAIDVTSTDNAQDSIAVVDQAIDDVTEQRSVLGAFQTNTLESGTNNLRTMLANTVAAESVIRDTDFAEEIAEFTKQQVLQQSGLSMLSTANQMPQMILSLLQG